MTHNEVVSRAIRAAKGISRDSVVRAFLASLSTRNLAARSLFGSYVVAQNLQAHEFRPAQCGADIFCAVCGCRESGNREQTMEKIEKYPFQVQHTNIGYACFDLENSASRLSAAPTEADLDIFRRMIDSIRSLPAEAQLQELLKSIQGIVKSNKFQRMILLETFGYAGILCPDDQEDFTSRFIWRDEHNSRMPEHIYKREWAYPVRFWTGQDGINDQKLQTYFGAYL